MRLLLDTPALLWWLADEGLTTQARDAIADTGNLIVVSAACAWEISIKKALGKLTAPDDLEHQIHAGGFVPLPISIAHGIAAGQLARHHEDPFDRVIIAQALAEGLTIVTRDKRFDAYGVPLLPRERHTEQLFTGGRESCLPSGDRRVGRRCCRR